MFELDVKLRKIIGFKFCVLQLPGSQEALLPPRGITLAADFHAMLPGHVCFTLFFMFTQV